MLLAAYNGRSGQGGSVRAAKKVEKDVNKVMRWENSVGERENWDTRRR